MPHHGGSSIEHFTREWLFFSNVEKLVEGTLKRNRVLQSDFSSHCYCVEMLDHLQYEFLPLQSAFVKNMLQGPVNSRLLYKHWWWW